MNPPNIDNALSRPRQRVTWETSPSSEGKSLICGQVEKECREDFKTIERVKKIKDLDLKAEDGEELTDAYVHILYCYMEKLQSIVRCYPGAPLTAIVDEMKELCDEHESTVTNRFLPEKKKGDAANCWNAIAHVHEWVWLSFKDNTVLSHYFEPLEEKAEIASVEASLSV